MELEKEPRKPTPPKATAPKPYQAQPTKTFLPTQKNYAQEVCVVMGVTFITVGLVGFVVDNLFGAHLSYTHNTVHVVSGLVALWFGFDSVKNAKIVSYSLGALYGIIGVLGFILGTQGMPTIGSITEDRFLWRIMPEALELGSVDHTLHLIFAAIFLIGASLNFKRFQNI